MYIRRYSAVVVLVLIMMMGLRECSSSPSSSSPSSSSMISVRVNSDTGADNETCISSSSSSLPLSPFSSTPLPCKTLQYALNRSITHASRGDTLLVTLETKVEGERVDVQDGKLMLSEIRLQGAGNGEGGYISDSIISILAYTTLSGIDITRSTLITWQNTFVDVNVSDSHISSVSLQTTSGLLTPNTNITASYLHNTTSTFRDLSVSMSEFYDSPVVVNGTCFVSSSRFSNTTSLPALHVYSCTIESSTFTHNNAQQDGAAVYAVLSLIVRGSTFTHNTAHNSGGAIYSIGVVRIEDSTLQYNSARYGGSICIRHITSIGALTFQCTASNISNNDAVMGGGVAIISGVVLTTYEDQPCVFSYNDAGVFGGGLYVANATVRGSAQWDLSYNTARRGGAVYIVDSFAELSGIISHNAVEYEEGASIYAANSQIQLTDMRIGAPWDLYGVGNSTSVHLVHSSSQMVLWYSVEFEGGIEIDRGLYCDDCEKDMCPASGSCDDCADGCMVFTPKTTPVHMCTSAHGRTFGCEHKGVCGHVAGKKTVCECKEGYRSDLCSEHDYSFKSFPVYAKVLMAVGGTLALIAAIIFIVRKFVTRNNTGEYQPL